MNDFIKLNDVFFAYESQDEQPSKNILNNFNLTIEKGSFVAILGHNGSGKSTLAKLFNGLNKPTSGNVFVEGIDTIDQENELEVRKKVGLIFQNPDNQIVATIVEEDVAFGPENLGIERDEIRRRVDDSLKAVGMYEYRKHEPHRLSGGQKQRVAIAGIIAMQPDCIVLDEPTAMLDPRGRLDVQDIILHLNKELGKTVILITHYMDEAALADRVVVMNKGDILLDGTPKKVFSNIEIIKSVGLDVPSATELAYELNKAGIDLGSEILTVDECVQAITHKLLGE